MKSMTNVSLMKNGIGEMIDFLWISYQCDTCGKYSEGPMGLDQLFDDTTEER